MLARKSAVDWIEMNPRAAFLLTLLLAASTSCRDAETPSSPSIEPAATSPSTEPSAAAKNPSPVAPLVRPEDFVARGYNLLFISLTNTRADHLGAWGYSRDTSPNIDGLARRGLVFENAFTHSSWTLPVVTSLLTSQYPVTHGLMDRKSFVPLPPETPTLVDALRRSGYRTAAFVGDRDYGGAYGLTSRFEELGDHVNEQSLADWKRYGVLESTVPAAIDWLRRHHDERFFLLVQGYDTHCPFAVPTKDDRFDPDYDGDLDCTRCYWTFHRTQPIRVRSKSGESRDMYLLKTKPTDGDEYDALVDDDDIEHMIALYDGEIRSADGHIGRLLRELETHGIDDKTIVVFFSDHGDMFGKHGRFMRGGPLRGTFYDDVLHVPLIVRHPRLAPRRVSGLTQVIDIAPTLLDILGIEIPSGFRGRSLRPLVLRDEAVNDVVFAGSAYSPDRRNPFFRHSSTILSVRSRDWKLILERLYFPSRVEEHFELFDLRADPDELTNRAETSPEKRRELLERLRGWLEGLGKEAYLTASEQP